MHFVAEYLLFEMLVCRKGRQGEERDGREKDVRRRGSRISGSGGHRTHSVLRGSTGVDIVPETYE